MVHELRIELAEDFDQIGLRGHDGVDRAACRVGRPRQCPDAVLRRVELHSLS
jgi:hypothetical protein